MTKNVLVALGLVAAIILAALYFFFSGGPPFKDLEKPKTPEVISPAVPEPEKPGEKPTPAPPPAPSPAPAPVPSPAPAPQEPPQPQPVPPTEKPVTKPEAAPPATKEAELPPLQPKEEYGLLAGSYRKYPDAAKMMEKLKKEGQPAVIRKEKGRYQVWVGPFSTPQETAAAAKALKGKVKIPSKIHKLVIPVPK